MNKTDYESQMIRKFTISCKCAKCGKKQIRSIADLVSNKDGCRLGRFNDPCGGSLSYYADDHDESVRNVVMVLNYLKWTTFRKDNSALAELVDVVTDDEGTWRESYETPQQMGWVGANGLP